jgi:glycosyltransferase involved in cell wall biosynthesis
MKIIYLIDGFPPYSWTSPGSLTLALAKEMASRGHEVFVVTTVQEKSQAGDEVYEGIKVYSIYSNYNLRWQSYFCLYNSETVSEVRKIITQIKPDICHFQNIHNRLSFYCLKVSKNLGIKTFITCHDVSTVHYGKFTEFINPADLSIPEKFNYQVNWRMLLKFARKRFNPLRNYLIRYYLKYADKIFAVSDELKKFLAANKINNVEVIHNYLDLDDFRRCDTEVIKTFKNRFNLGDKKIIIFGGRLSEAKGGRQIIKALAPVVKIQPNLILLIIGEKNYYVDDMLNLAEMLGLKDKLIFAGFLLDEDLKAAYSSAKIAVFPSVCFDTFGMVNLEAMAVGLPVIATCFGGSREVVADKQTGYIINPYNIEDFASKITQLLDQSEQSELMGQKGKKRAEELFNLPLAADKLIDYYHRPNYMNSTLITKVKQLITKRSAVFFSAFLPLAFIFMVTTWYAPIAIKGYPAVSPEWHMILAARNFARGGVLGSENKLNVVVAPEQAVTEAQASSLGNNFTSLAYAGVFKLYPSINWNQLTLLAIIISALAGLLFNILVYRRYGLGVALLFPFIYTLFPFNQEQAQFLGTYEFCLLFFAIFCLLSFGGKAGKWKELRWLLAGLFLALSCLSREAMYVFAPLFGFWLIFKRRFKELAWVVIPAGIVVLVLPLVMGWGGINNDYLKLILNQSSNVAATQKYSDFDFFGHIFPDPYTFHFNHDEYLNSYQNKISSAGLIDRLQLIKSGNNMGEIKINLIDRFLIGTLNLSYHLYRFVAFEFFGGPLILLLLFIGLWQLKRRSPSDTWFFVYWLTSIVLLLSYATLVMRSHLMDFGWVLAVLVSLGIISLWPIVKEKITNQKNQIIVYAGIIIAVMLNLLLADKMYLGQAYKDNMAPQMFETAEQIRTGSDLESGVIAVGCRDGHNIFNFLTGKPFIYFDADDILQLAGEGKLQTAFNLYGVKQVACFSPEVSAAIASSSSAQILAVWPN